MTSKERLQAVIEGRVPDRVPVCLHNFLMAADEAGIPIERYRSEPAAIAEAHLRALEKYGHDCILVDIDTTLLAEAMGARSSSAPGEPAHIAEPAIRDICGNTTLILDALAGYPRCGFELDYKTDAARAKRTAGAGHVLFGNIDPSGVVARGTPGEVRAACEKLIGLWKPGGDFILNSGCAIPAGTPPENVHALVRSTIEFGGY
jgi:uroporphyrinogen-III decarboxylase